MELKPAQIDEFAAIAPRHILRAFQVGNGISRGTDRAAVAAAYEQRFFIGCRHFFYLQIQPKAS
jgi:hypothetical protein